MKGIGAYHSKVVTKITLCNKVNFTLQDDNKKMNDNS